MLKHSLQEHSIRNRSNQYDLCPHLLCTAAMSEALSVQKWAFNIDAALLHYIHWCGKGVYYIHSCGLNCTKIKMDQSMVSGPSNLPAACFYIILYGTLHWYGFRGQNCKTFSTAANIHFWLSYGDCAIYSAKKTMHETRKLEIFCGPTHVK